MVCVYEWYQEASVLFQLVQARIYLAAPDPSPEPRLSRRARFISQEDAKFYKNPDRAKF